MRLSNIARPDSCRQSVHGVVRALEHVVIVGEGNCGNHRTENLLAYHLHVFGGIDQHGGFHEIAFVAMTLTADYGLGALRLPAFEVTTNPVELFFGNERSHVTGGLPPGADVDLFGFG